MGFRPTTSCIRGKWQAIALPDFRWLSSSIAALYDTTHIVQRAGRILNKLFGDAWDSEREQKEEGWLPKLPLAQTTTGWHSTFMKIQQVQPIHTKEVSKIVCVQASQLQHLQNLYWNLLSLEVVLAQLLFYVGCHYTLTIWGMKHLLHDLKLAPTAQMLQAARAKAYLCFETSAYKVS